jgi:hypothetical protein
MTTETKQFCKTYFQICRGAGQGGCRHTTINRSSNNKHWKVFENKDDVLKIFNLQHAHPPPPPNVNDILLKML